MGGWMDGPLACSLPHRPCKSLPSTLTLCARSDDPLFFFNVVNVLAIFSVLPISFRPLLLRSSSYSKSNLDCGFFTKSKETGLGTAARTRAAFAEGSAS